MKPTLQPGVRYLHRYLVPDNKTVPYVFEESEQFRAMPPIFATAFMVGLMEWACMEALAPHLDKGEGSLGIHINVSHSAPTPPGMEVSVEVTCAEVAGQRSVWEIVARDEVEEIGRGTHERYTVDLERFARKAAAKKG